jgi:F-box protein 9
VHEDYKKKHFPPSAFAKPKAPPTAANSSKTVGAAQNTTVENPTPSLPATLKQLVDDFSLLQIEPAPPETDYSPQKPCHLAEIPEEILSHILLELAIIDVASFARMAQVCKRLAYLVLTEESIWKAVTLSEEYGFPAMHYNYATTIEGRPLEDDFSDLRQYQEDDSDSKNLPLQTLKSLSYTQSLLPSPYPSWRQMFRTRPRLRFNGCYISTVNYARPGAHASNSLAWGAPVLVVTYFRYLRFFRDGTAISLLSTTEPADVVHHLTKANLDLYDSSRKTRGHHHHNQGSTATSALPGAVMKEALRGRWRLSGPLHSSSSSSNTKIPPSSSPSPADPNEATELPSEDIEEPAEEEGTVHIETQGVVPRYTYKLALALGHAGKSARNNKLAWKGFWSYNRLSDDWGEFSLRNDRAFYWSRVRSYDGWE